MAHTDDINDPKCSILNSSSGTACTGFTVNLFGFNTCDTCGHCRKSEPCKHCGAKDLFCEKLGIVVESDFYCKEHTSGQSKSQPYPYTPTIPNIPWYPEPVPVPNGPIWLVNENNSVTIQDNKKKSINRGDTE